MLKKYWFEHDMGSIPAKEVVTAHAPIEEVCRILTPQVYFSLLDWGTTENGDLVTQIQLMGIMTGEMEKVTGSFPTSAEPIAESIMPGYIHRIRQIASQDQDAYFALSPFVAHDMSPNPDFKFSLFMNEAAKSLSFRAHRAIDSADTPSNEHAWTDALDSICPARGETRSIVAKQLEREFGYGNLLGTANVYGVNAEILPYILPSHSREWEDMAYDTVVFLVSMGYRDVSQKFLLHQFEDGDIPRVNKVVAAQYLRVLQLQSYTTRDIFDRSLESVRADANHGLISDFESFHAMMLLEIGAANRENN